MKKYTKLFTFFILFLFCFLSANRSYAQNAYVLLELESWQQPKIKLHLYRQDSVLIDSFELVIDNLFILKIPIKEAYYLKIVSLNNLTDYKDMDKIIPLDLTQTEPYIVIKQIIDLQQYECCVDFGWDNIHFPVNSANILSVIQNKEILEMLIKHLQLFPFTKVKFTGHTDHLEKNKQNLSFKRAESVKDYLLSHKIPNSRIEIDGKGDTQPTVPNIVDGKKDKNNMILNRRVQFNTSHLFGSTKKAIVLVFADSIAAQESQVTGNLYYPSGDSMEISEKCIYSYENIKILYLFSAFDYILEVKRNNNVVRLPIDLSKKMEGTVVVEL